MSILPPELSEPGLLPYADSWQAMRDYTAQRDANSPDQLWLLQHPPTYTLGQAGRAEHIHNAPAHIPIVHSDRGGQITYHGPGQAILYTLIDLPRRQLGVRALVSLLEQSVIELLHGYHIDAGLRDGAPGVYCNNAKIASLGLRVRKGRSYHGIALNIDMDLTPFSHIDPCGYPGLAVTQLKDLGGPSDVIATGRQLAAIISRRLMQHGESS